MWKIAIFLAATSAVALGGILPCENELGGEEYVVGGKDTKIEDAPYQVSLYLGTKYLCGGTIISKNYVLTAAHCVVDEMGNINKDIPLYINAGSSTDLGGKITTAKNIYPHPKFNYETIDCDVAVLEMTTPVEFSNKIKAIKLAEKLPADGELAKVSGWGCLKENGTRPTQLQSVMVPIVNRKICEKSYKQFIDITERMFCAGAEGKDACKGDSGGPLAYKDTLIGVISIGHGCGRKEYPGIYAVVSHPDIRKFIKEKSGV